MAKFKNSPIPYVYKECAGEAHQPSSSAAAGCQICFPFWLYVPTCPKCSKSLRVLVTPPETFLVCDYCDLYWHRSEGRSNA